MKSEVRSLEGKKLAVFRSSGVQEERMFYFLFQDCLLPLASCLLPLAYCLLPIASCLLPLASCLLPLAYCLLPIASCLLPLAAKATVSIKSNQYPDNRELSLTTKRTTQL
jgi:hypothetical protein